MEEIKFGLFIFVFQENGEKNIKLKEELILK